MSSGNSWFLGLGLLCSIAATTAGCDDSDTNPPTFHERCEDDASVCADPFECVAVHPGGATEGEPIPICTRACKRDRECPHLGDPDGHCGVYQTVCIDGFCQGWCQ